MSHFSVHVQVDHAFVEQVTAETLRLAAEQALSAASAAAPAALTVVVTDTQRVRALNAQYLGDDAPTDVLSFPAEEDPATRDAGEPPYLGDVLIALPVAEQQAKAAGHGAQDELHLLTVHGVLHLLGYDHETPDQQAAMWALQSQAMDALREALR